MTHFPSVRSVRQASVAESPASPERHLSDPVKVLLIGALISACWSLTVAIGGARLIGTHSFYIPLLLGAHWFGSPGAMVTGVVAAVVAGPLLPLDTATGSAQLEITWLSRALAFQVIGQTVAWFLGRQKAQGSALERAREVVETVNDRLVQERAGEEEQGQAIRELRSLIDDPGSIRIVFQPLIDLSTGKPMAMEALSRFTTEPPRKPDEMFDHAWTVGLGIELELAAVDRAVAFIRRLPSDCLLTVNVSPDTVISEEFAELMSSLPVERLVLELTEHSRIDEYQAVNEALKEFRQAGGRLAIDDTGAGYASFRHVLELEPDIIKLDIELTRSVETDPALRSLTQSLLRLGVELDAIVVAEGVETFEQLAALRDLGVRYAQGFYLSEPRTIRLPEARPHAEVITLHSRSA